MGRYLFGREYVEETDGFVQRLPEAQALSEVFFQAYEGRWVGG